MIVAKMATIERRKPSLMRVIDSLLPQVDALRIYMNDYLEDIPGVEVFGGEDLGDVGKIAPPHEEGDFIFLVDDDIIYPKDYVSRMMTFAEQFQCIAGVHGAILKPPIQNYFKDRQVFHFATPLMNFKKHPVGVHVLGTGTVGYNSKLFSLSPQDAPEPNMLDVFCAVKAQKDRIPMKIINRRQNWLRPAIKEDPNSLWRTRGAGERQTAWINTVQKWSIF